MAFQQRGGKRQTKVWIPSGIASNVTLSQTQANVGSIGVTLGEGADPSTILRIRGRYAVFATPNAAADVETVQMGIIVVSATAGAVGGASLPGPIADAGADWLWYDTVFLDAVDATAANGQNIGLNRYGTIDSKGMRKIRTDQALVFMAELSSGEMASDSR